MPQDPKKPKTAKPSLATRYQVAYDHLRAIRLEIGRVRHRLLSIKGVSPMHHAYEGQLIAAREEIQAAEAMGEALLAEMKAGGAR